MAGYFDGGWMGGAKLGGDDTLRRRTLGYKTNAARIRDRSIAGQSRRDMGSDNRYGEAIGLGGKARRVGEEMMVTWKMWSSLHRQGTTGRGVRQLRLSLLATSQGSFCCGRTEFQAGANEELARAAPPSRPDAAVEASTGSIQMDYTFARPDSRLWGWWHRSHPA